MKKTILGLFLLTLTIALPSSVSAFDRNAYIKGARASSVLTNIYNSNIVAINLSANGTQVSGGAIPLTAASQIETALAKLQALKERLRQH